MNNAELRKTIEDQNKVISFIQEKYKEKTGHLIEVPVPKLDYKNHRIWSALQMRPNLRY